MKYEDKILQIITDFGVLNQLKYFQSEVYELTEAIIKFENGIGDIKDIIDEVGDVEMMLDQFKCWYEITKDETFNKKDFKADRTLERKKNGYYN